MQLMNNSYKHFSNKECEFFPCHNTEETSTFNCMFCYCPLYHYSDSGCGGNYVMLENGFKDCSACILPHTNYDYIIKTLRKENV